jgi:hypothetical protein
MVTCVDAAVVRYRMSRIDGTAETCEDPAGAGLIAGPDASATGCGATFTTSGLFRVASWEAADDEP